jgi:hypothetical protein
MLTRRCLLWLGPSGSFMDFGFSAGFFLNSSVEQELDLFIQRPMLHFSASSAIRGIPPALGLLTGVRPRRVRLTLPYESPNHARTIVENHRVHSCATLLLKM